MAFFGLTQLGYQNLIKERTIPDFREGTEIGDLKYYDKGMKELRKGPVRRIALDNGSYPAPTLCPGVENPAKNAQGKSHSACPQTFPPILPHKTDPKAEIQPFDHGNSCNKLKELRYRHIRSGKEPVELYRYPVLTSHEIGRWRSREPLAKCEPWTQGPRFIYSESEMTKYVFIFTF